MNEIKNGNGKIYPLGAGGSESSGESGTFGTENRTSLSYGRIAYDKAAENEKRIAANNKARQINEIRSITETDSIKELKGEMIEKAVKFESAGEIIEAEVTVTCEYYCVISVYLNDKLIGTADKAAENHCVFETKSAVGENVLYVMADGAVSDSAIKVVVSGKVKKIPVPQEIKYFGKDCYAVKQDDRITLFYYTGEKFEKVYSLCGLKTSCACFDKDNAVFYVAGKFYSGHTVIYSVEQDGSSIINIDDVIDYSHAAINYNSLGLYFYYIVGGSLCFAYMNEYNTMITGGAIRKGVKEVYFMACESDDKIILKDSYDRYIVCKVYGSMIKDQVNLGSVCRPHIPYGNISEVICKNGDETSESGSYTIDISNNKAKVGKPFKDRFPVTVTDTCIVGTENGEPIILEKLQ